MKLVRICTITFVILGVLCGKAFSQGTFFLELDATLQPIGEFNYLHGMGVHDLSSYDEAGSFELACEKALEELNTNLFLSVYIEEFRLGSQKDYSFPEISIRDSVLTFEDHNIVKVDSFAVAGDAYCTVAFENYGTSGISDRMPTIQDVRKSPIKVGNTWYALGAADKSRLNTMVTWMKAKNNALKDLTRVLKTTIQSSVIQIDEREAEATYFKSNMIYEDVVILRRYMTSKKLIVMVAVPQDRILEY